MFDGKYVNTATIVAFILGVLLSAAVKGIVTQLRGHAASAVGG